MKRSRPLRLPLAVLLLAACRGEGSDIGPNLNRIRPPLPFQVTLRDDQSRAVCGALVRSPVGDAVSGSVGRAEVPAVLPAPGLVTVATTAASAVASDRLVGFTCAVTPVDDGAALPRALFLPDISASNSLLLTAGAQGSAAVLDDTPTSGAMLTIDAGTVVTDGTATSVTLSTGGLQPRHHPVDPPTSPGVPMLVSRAVMLTPTTATFVPGATLELPDDLGASGSSAVVALYRLDEATGTWAQVGAATAGSSTLRSAVQGVARGGLYMFAAVATRAATLSGRILDVDARPLAGVILQCSGLTARSNATGEFQLGPLAPVDFNDNARIERLELIGGRGYLPVHLQRDVTLADGPVPLGDITFDTRPSSHLRVLAIERGRLLTDRRLRTNQSLRESFVDGFAGADGAVVFDDVAIGIYGFVDGRAESINNCFRLESVLRINPLDRFSDARVFSVRTNYDEVRRGTVAFARDVGGGGPLEGVVMVRGTVPEQGFIGRTFEGGSVFLGIGTADELTAVSDTTRDGRRVISAFTVVGTSAHRLELPVRTVGRADLGAFDRHGLITGTVTGGTAGNPRELRATYPLAYSDWVERTLLGGVQRSGGRVPTKVAPTTDATAQFTIGVPRPRGHVSLVETASGELRGAFVAFDQAPAEGAITPLGGALLPAATRFNVLNARLNVDPRLTDLRFDWALRAPNGSVADLARGLAGVGMFLSDPRGSFMLPELSGSLAGAQHLVRLYGEASAGGVTVGQSSVMTIRGTSGSVAPALLPVPQLVAPAPGAVVGLDGFRIEFAADPAAVFVVGRLSSDVGTELREWSFVAPAYATRFDVRKLPTEATAILAPGRTWQLSLTAYAIVDGPVFQQRNPYNTVIANLISLPWSELGVQAASSVTISLSTP